MTAPPHPKSKALAPVDMPRREATYKKHAPVGSREIQAAASLQALLEVIKILGESLILAIRKELVLGAPVGETRSKHGIGHPTRGKWKSQ